ncbi:hypothetical protein CF335_g7004 [Tilletia laevis]|nr:hypothetical protein CF335_g7004 [Tilletia laevis]
MTAEWQQPRCRQGCMDPNNPTMRALLPCVHGKKKKQPKRNTGIDAAAPASADISAPALSTPAVSTPALSAPAAPAPTAPAQVPPPSHEHFANEAPPSASSGRIAPEMLASIHSTAAADAQTLAPGVADAARGAEATLLPPSFFSAAVPGAVSSSLARAIEYSLQETTGPQAPIPPSTGNASNSGNGYEQREIMTDIADTNSMQPDLPAESERVEDDSGMTESAPLPSSSHQQSDQEQDEEDGDVRGGPTRAESVKVKEATKRAIWLNLATAHEHGMKNHKLEANVEERSRIANRGTWRLIEQAAKLSRRTDMGIIVAYAHLDHGKHKIKDYVYVSPNLCDPSRTTLRSMAQKIHTDFTDTVTAYREAGRAQVALDSEARKAWVAERVAMRAEMDRLRAELDAEKGKHATSTSPDAQQLASGPSPRPL